MARLVASFVHFYCLDWSGLALVFLLLIEHVSINRQAVQILEIWKSSHEHVDLKFLLKIDVEAFEHRHCGKTLNEGGKVVEEDVL